jgi:SGNH hydrolase-like domain, acetyltransferase AlgX
MAAPKQIHRFLQNLLLTLSSVLLSLLIVEIFSRVVLDPVDFLKPVRIHDPMLGYSIEPRSGGHDSWGFRNRAVPAASKIVAIGDSQTYGASATAKDSWPSALQRIIKTSVYNLSLGGYGPVQYFHLLTNHALKLSPDVVIVGFYLGNDLFDAYKVVQKNENWQHLRYPGFTATAHEASNPADEDRTRYGAELSVSRLRIWLAQHSVLYKVLIYSAIGEVARTTEGKLLGGAQGEASILYDRNGILTGFNPGLRLKALDLKDSRVREGLLISLDLFSEMNAYCVKQNISLLVALIPTKESVYAKYLEDDPVLGKAAVIQLSLESERKVNATIKAFFENQNIAYLDLLPYLQEQVGQKQLYPGNYDGHPNKNGYRVIAEALARYLRERQAQVTGSDQKD